MSDTRGSLSLKVCNFQLAEMRNLRSAPTAAGFLRKTLTSEAFYRLIFRKQKPKISVQGALPPGPPEVTR